MTRNAMPSRKPQVMWIALTMTGNKMWNTVMQTKKGAIMAAQAEYIARPGPTWKEMYSWGWRIIKIEVREIKKGKTK